MTVGNAACPGASHRSTTRRCASHLALRNAGAAGDIQRLARFCRGRSRFTEECEF
jgi:hypothetical protein